MEYNIKKLIEVCAKFIQLEGGTLNYLKLMKYLYLLEKKTITEFGYSISNDSIVSMKHGPVLSTTLDIIRGNYISEEKDLWDQAFDKERYVITSKKEFDFKTLSNNELIFIETLVEEHIDKDQFGLRDYVHKTCPEWTHTNSSLPLGFPRILQKSNLSEEEQELLMHEVEDAAFLLNFK